MLDAGPLWLTMKETSTLTGIPVGTLRWWRKIWLKGEPLKGPASVKVVGGVKYRRADVVAWVNSFTPDTPDTPADAQVIAESA
jgi:hypothetical protein